MAKQPHARVTISSNFKGQTPLVQKLIDYKAGLPTNNWIGALEVSEGITLAQMLVKAGIAEGYDELKDSNYNFALEANQSRDKGATSLVSRMEGGFQVVKKIVAPDFAQVREWGADMTVDGKSTMPSNVTDQMGMFKKYSDKYATYSVSTAPIEFYQVKHGYIMADDVVTMGNVNDFQTNANSFRVISENNTELRNNEWEIPLKFIVKVYNVGKATYKDFYRELGLMGFTIAMSAPGHKNQKSTALQGSQIGIHGAIIGSVMENLENFDVILHPGGVLSKTPIIFKANSMMAVTKGMSQFILENPNLLAKAKIMVTVRSHG